jgi:hypothetical protein
MKQILRIIVMVCALVADCMAQNPVKAGAVIPMGYELYSWPHGVDWNFSLLYNTNSEKTVEEVFAKRFLIQGLEPLKAKILTLPKGSTIFWLDRIPSGTKPKARGSEKLACPPAAVVKEIADYAAKQEVKAEVFPCGKDW